MIPIDRFTGFLYRALNPVYARDPLSGRGAQVYGGRFNPKGTAALYASLSPVTALREANQVGALQPTTLVAYEADVRPVFDTRDAEALAGFDITPKGLASVSWRDDMIANGECATQTFARRLIAEGFAALLVPSFARGAAPTDLNLVLWRWGDAAPTNSFSSTTKTVSREPPGSFASCASRAWGRRLMTLPVGQQGLGPQNCVVTLFRASSCLLVRRLQSKRTRTQSEICRKASFS